MGKRLLAVVRSGLIAPAVVLALVCAQAAYAQTGATPALRPTPVSDVAGTPALRQAIPPALTSDTPQGDTYGLDPLPGATASPNDDRYGFNPMPPAIMPAPAAAPARKRAGSAPAPAASSPVTMPVLPQQPQNDAVHYGAQVPPAGNRPIYAAPGTGLQPAAFGSRNNNEGGGDVSAVYRLGPGDKVHVGVFGEADLSGDYTVDGTGMVHLPLIGAQRASGLTAQTLGRNITAALAAGYLKNPRVNVDIVTYRPFYIIGAVNRPGQYAYVDNMDVMNAVALAGGFTDQAVQSVVYVRHEGSARETRVPTDRMTRVLPGDVIRVETTLFWTAMNLFSPIAGPAAIAAAATR